MDVKKSGELLRELRKNAGMTQKELAEKLGVLPKTVSKWETGHGFCDVALVPGLAKALGVSAESLLSGTLSKNEKEVGNMKKIKFYVCPACGNIITQTGAGEVFCCGKKLEAQIAKSPDEAHKVKIENCDDEIYVTWSHPMEKSHYISFIACVGYDRAITVKLYPEQGGEARLPRIPWGKIYYYCENHGFFKA